MFENDLAMFKLQLKLALKDKLIFFYTLIIPIIMLFVNRGQSLQDNEALYIYWSYIVVTTVLNGFLMKLIQLRENGFLKTLSYLTGSKLSIIMSAFLVQLVVVQLEILMFNLVVTVLITPVSLMTFLYGFLVSFMATLLCSAMLSGLLILKIKYVFFNLLIAGFLFSGIILLGIRPTGHWNYLLTIFNPFQLIYGLYVVPCTSIVFEIFIGICIICYLWMGFLIINNVSIRSHLSRVKR